MLASAPRRTTIGRRMTAWMETDWSMKWFRTNSMLKPKIKVYGGTGKFERRGSERELLEVIETRDGEVLRLLSINGHNLSPKERDIDDKRTKKFLSDSHELQEKQKIRSEDADQERKLMTMLSAAFDYQYDGKDEHFIRLRFIPNPDFHPRGRESEVFHHMEGTMLVDLRRKRLAGLDGRLTDEVKFMGGLLGHLDRGGIFSVRQRDVGSGHWKMTMLHVQMNGKALLFKTIALHEKEEYTNFQPLPNNMTLEKAANYLKMTRLVERHLNRADCCRIVA